MRRFFALLVIVALSIFPLCACDSVKNERHEIFGLTIDDAWYDDIEQSDVIEGLKNLKRRPLVRIVMSGEIDAEDYIELFQAVEKYADIMACPVDSSEMNAFGAAERYLERFEDAFENLSPYVSVWEVGNEINGTEWIRQQPELIVEKASRAAEYIKSRGGRVALTLYCTDSPDEDLIAWTRKHIPEALADSVDYCFVSYYEDDNEGYAPDWKHIFAELGEIFSSSFLGIGECGNSAEGASEASKIALAKKYYGMAKMHERFVGGFFWWNWVEDCIPYEGNKIYEAIKSYN